MKHKTLPNSEIEESYTNKGSFVIGVDECGIGSLVGPVISCAVLYMSDLNRISVNDSKKLTPKKRNSLFNELLVCSNIIYAIGMANLEEVDELNVHGAAMLAMQRAVKETINILYEKNFNSINSRNIVILVDGNRKIDINNLEVIPIVKGDSKSVSIASASIIAKVTRDKIMIEKSSQYPLYSLDKNMGYPTPKHIRSIIQHGPSDYHRKSMIRKFI